MLDNITLDLTTLLGSEKLIIQQTNLKHVSGQLGRGLALALSQRWSHCRPYDRQGISPDLGSIQIIPSEHNSPLICCLNAQRTVGRQQKNEDYDKRLSAFTKGLNELAQLLNDDSFGIKVSEVYIPYKIGCGLGHGDWSKYSVIVEDFSTKVTQPTYLVHLQEFDQINQNK